MSFNWTSLAVGQEYEHVATLGITAGGLLAAGFYARSQVMKDAATAVAPASRFSIKGIFELITEFITGLADMVIGEHGRKFVPMFAAIFTFILFNNLMGVIPGMTPATEYMSTTLAMGIFMFLTYNYLGLKENGIGYIKHFFGPVIWLAPMMFIIEIASHLVRPISLGLRLANVMKGDHTVVGIFLDLVPIGLPIPFYVLGMFVAGIQAFVFTLLSMVYIALATAHDH